MTNVSSFTKLVDVMARLRAPDGCPWDREQTHATLKPYLLEETYEALEAIDAHNDDELCRELGDVLLQVVFHAQIAAEESEQLRKDGGSRRRRVARGRGLVRGVEAAAAAELEAPGGTRMS